MIIGCDKLLGVGKLTLTSSVSPWSKYSCRKREGVAITYMSVYTQPLQVTLNITSASFRNCSGVISGEEGEII